MKQEFYRDTRSYLTRTKSQDLDKPNKLELSHLSEIITEDSKDSLSQPDEKEDLGPRISSVEEVIERKGREKSREMFEFYRKPIPTSIQSNKFQRNTTIHKQRTCSSIGSASRHSIDMHESDMLDDASIVSIQLEPKQIITSKPASTLIDIKESVISPKSLPTDELRINDPSVLEFSLSRRSIANGAQEALSSVEEIDVLCVNCYKCIAMDNVDEHSSTCCKNIASVPEDEEGVNSRIHKLLESMYDRQQVSVGDKVLYLIQLQEIAHCIIESTISLDTILSRLEKIASNSILVSEGYSCAIYARRLAHLAQAKSDELPIEEHSEDSVLQKYEEEAARQRQELEKWKLRSELLMQLASSNTDAITEVRSDLDERVSVFSLKSCMSSVTELGLDVSGDFADLKSANEMLDDINEEEQERYFYSLFLRKKYKLPRNHKGREMSIKESYEECLSKKVPINIWEKYIDNILDSIPLSL